MIGVSSDRPDKLQRFAGKNGFRYPLLADVDRTVLKEYGVLRRIGFPRFGFDWTRRATYLIDANGIIRKVYPRVRVATHARDLLRDAPGPDR